MSRAGRIDEAVVNFLVFEDGIEYYGMAEVTLPEINYITQESSGAGIAGNFESVILGHFESMTLGLNFRTPTRDAITLLEPREHLLELRVAQQHKNTVSRGAEIVKLKHVFVVTPKGFNPGNVTPMAAADASGQYAVTYWKMLIGGVEAFEIDIHNMICRINGVDYLEEVRAALGKS